MSFDFYAANPALDEEKDEYHTTYEKTENNLIFFNNFFFKALPNGAGRTGIISLAKNNNIQTFEELTNYTYASLNLPVDQENYSPLLQNMNILHFYNHVDNLLAQKSVLEQIKNYDGHLSELLLPDKKLQEACIAVYFTLREEGFYRYKDLIA